MNMRYHVNAYNGGFNFLEINEPEDIIVLVVRG